MKILYIGNDLSGQSKYHTAYATLKQNLITEGYQVYSASSQKNQILRLLEMVFKTFLYGKKVNYVLIDVFSTHAFYFALIISQIAKFLHAKYIPILHGGNLPSRLQTSPKLCRLMFGDAYKIVAPSAYLQVAFKKRGYNAVLIPNTINTKSMVFKQRKTIAPYLLYARAFADIYNPVLAVEVLKELQKLYPMATLCMVGPDRDGTLQQVKEKIAIYGLEKSIEITGVLPKEAWHQLSEKYDVFINTTNVDNTPVSLIEAMALGMPIVSTNVGGIPYLVLDGQEGLLVAPNDILQMANAIKQLLAKPNKVAEISVKARAKALQMDWGVVKESWFKILV